MEADLKRHIGGDLLAEFDDNLAINPDNITFGGTAFNDIADLSTDPSFQASDFIDLILIEFLDLKILNHQGTFILVDTLTGKDLGINDNS